MQHEVAFGHHGQELTIHATATANINTTLTHETQEYHYTFGLGGELLSLCVYAFVCLVCVSCKGFRDYHQTNRKLIIYLLSHDASFADDIARLHLGKRAWIHMRLM